MGGHRDEMVYYERPGSIAYSILCESTGAGHNDRLSDHLSYGSSYTELF